MGYLLSIPCLIAALVAAGFLYQWLGAHFDRWRYSAGGRWIAIGGGQRIYLLEKGTGEATVLFESGIAATNLNWFHIQETVSRFAATASYDRGGLGWSSPSRTARTPGNLASELHELMQEAGLKPPYILVGHSFGGLVIRRFALLYPEEVASIVLVDPLRCEEWLSAGPGKAGEAGPRHKAREFRDSDCATGIGPTCCDLTPVPFGTDRRSAGLRCWRRRYARARPDQRRSGQDASGGMAERSRSLVAAELLRRDAQPSCGGAGYPAGNAGRRAHSRDSRFAADTGQIVAAFR